MESADRMACERALRRAVLAGDAAAWRAWYDQTFAQLDAYVLWRCAGLRDLADEVLQETWLVAVRRIRAFDPERAAFATWLGGIAANVLRNLLRRRRFRSSKQEPLLWEPAAAAEGMTPTEGRERGEGIARALAELPERYERVLRAKYLDGRNMAEIAADWGESPKAIESLLTRAREAFRTAYDHPEEQP
jgi:RNA polymerase sigma-70 factor (ECF subfamily)